MPEKNEGTIAYLAPDGKGYGFIHVVGVEKGVFFHAKELTGIRIDELTRGDKVIFDELIEGDKGKSARNVRLNRG